MTELQRHAAGTAGTIPKRTTSHGFSFEPEAWNILTYIEQSDPVSISKRRLTIPACDTEGLLLECSYIPVRVNPLLLTPSTVDEIEDLDDEEYEVVIWHRSLSTPALKYPVLGTKAEEMLFTQPPATRMLVVATVQSLPVRGPERETGDWTFKASLQDPAGVKAKQVFEFAEAARKQFRGVRPSPCYDTHKIIVSLVGPLTL